MSQVPDDKTGGDGPGDVAEVGEVGGPARWQHMALVRAASMWAEALRRLRGYVERKGN